MQSWPCDGAAARTRIDASAICRLLSRTRSFGCCRYLPSASIVTAPDGAMFFESKRAGLVARAGEQKLAGRWRTLSRLVDKSGRGWTTRHVNRKCGFVVRRLVENFSNCGCAWHHWERVCC